MVIWLVNWGSSLLASCEELVHKCIMPKLKRLNWRGSWWGLTSSYGVSVHGRNRKFSPNFDSVPNAYKDVLKPPPHSLSAQNPLGCPEVCTSVVRITILAIHVAISNTSMSAILDCVWVISDKAYRHGGLLSINVISSPAIRETTSLQSVVATYSKFWLLIMARWNENSLFITVKLKIETASECS